MWTNPVVIAGAGVGGLATAIRLQAAGVPTVLVDRNPRAGGKLNLEEGAGFRFDTGPSLLTMPEVFEELFRTAGLDFKTSVPLIRLDRHCRYVFPDGEELDTSDSMTDMSRTLLDRAPHDVEAFFGFLSRAAALYRMSAESVIMGPPIDWRNFRSTDFNPVEFFRMRPFERLDKYLDRTFQDERIRRICRLIGLYTGCAPDRTPAIFALIPFLEFGLGRWYLQGGLYRIAELLLARYRELGGDYRPETSVRRIVFEKGKAVAAELEPGGEIRGSHFVVNADVALAASTFLSEAPGASRIVRRLGKLSPTVSAFVLMIGTRADTSHLIHHNLLFSSDEKREWAEVFGRGVPPSDASIYLNNPSHTDRTIAPEGASALFAMVNVPADDPSKWDWREKADSYEEMVLDRLERSVPGLRGSIEVKFRRTPIDFRERTWADRGSLYGRAPDSLRAMMARPKNRETGFDGISFVGGTTHPGAGIPLAALSGKLVSDLIVKEAE